MTTTANIIESPVELPVRFADQEEGVRAGKFILDAAGFRVAEVYVNEMGEFSARALNAVNDLAELVKGIADEPVRHDLICHGGICPMEECNRCRRIIKARQVLAGLRPPHAFTADPLNLGRCKHDWLPVDDACHRPGSESST